MPIYAYRCASCGHAQDVLQKMSDPLLTVCTSCGAATFEKQVTAAGFQLKGSGWYVTDFRGGNTGAKKADAEGGDVPVSADKAADKATETSGEKATEKAAAPAEAKPAAKAADSSPAPAPKPVPAAPSGT